MNTDRHGLRILTTEAQSTQRLHSFLCLYCNRPITAQLARILLISVIHTTMPQNVCRLRKFLMSHISNRKDTKSAKTELVSPFLCALRVFAVDSDASNLVAAPVLCALGASVVYALLLRLQHPHEKINY